MNEKENPRLQPGASEHPHKGNIHGYDVSTSMVNPIAFTLASSDSHGIARALLWSGNGFVIIPAMALHDRRTLIQAFATQGHVLEELVAARLIKNWRDELPRLPTLRSMLAAFIFAVHEQRGDV